MNAVFNLQILFPILFLFLQTFLILFIGLSLLKRLKVLRTPYAELEYGEAIMAGSLLVSMLLVSSADTTGLFQAYKSYQNGGRDVFQSTFYKFSQFFMILLFLLALLLLAAYFVTKLLFGLRSSLKDMHNENAPTSVLFALIIVGFSVVLRLVGSELVELITPQYFNIR